MKTKHQITPYKGGRNTRLYARVTEAEKEMIEEKKRKYDLSTSDLIVESVKKYKPTGRGRKQDGKSND